MPSDARRALPASALRAAFALACVATAAWAFAYLFLEYRDDDSFARRFAASGPAVPAHFFAAGLALLLVPLQISSRVRRRWPSLHRAGGLLSVAAILVGGTSGLWLAQEAHGGWPSRLGFSVLSVLWIGFTLQGLRSALARDFAWHRRWMAMGIALTTGAITLRLILGIGNGLLQLPFTPVYVTASWASWLFNLAVCAWLLRAPRRHGAGAMRWGFRRPAA